MSDRKPSPFPVLLNNDVCSLIQAAENVYQIRFKNRAANAYLVRGKLRTIMIDVGLSSNYSALLECLNNILRAIVYRQRRSKIGRGVSPGPIPYAVGATSPPIAPAASPIMTALPPAASMAF